MYFFDINAQNSPINDEIQMGDDISYNSTFGNQTATNGELNGQGAGVIQEAALVPDNKKPETVIETPEQIKEDQITKTKQKIKTFAKDEKTKFKTKTDLWGKRRS